MNEKKPIAIIGAGGHAKVLLDVLLLTQNIVVAFLEKDLKNNSVFRGVPIIDESEFWKKYKPNECKVVNGVGSVRSTSQRLKVYERFLLKGYEFHSVIHPSAIISAYSELSNGVQVMAGTVIQAGCKIGANTIINTHASIDHDCQIGDHVHIAPGCTLSGKVIVGEGTHVGAGSTIIQGIHIGEKSIIGAGAVVIKDVPDLNFSKGIPAYNQSILE